MIAIAVDDEPIALDIVRSHASKVLTITLAEVFTNAFDAMHYLQQHQVDLIFLDIKMPDINGIDFLHALSNPPMVIFTTAYSEHAVKSFELDAIDYLLKPFSLPRFLKACNKANEIYNLRLNAFGDKEQDFLFIKDSYEQIKVQIDDILYIEAAGNYTRINLKNKKLLSTRVPINEMLQMLPAKKFIRTHRAFIVAINKIDKYDRNLIWMGDKTIPIGNTYSQCLQGFS
ncbi:MAG: response regulator transcription factor [Pedobacter sp.]|nr:response regulator transcription factor [Pedobacter sp.]